jgi:HAD superfamily hydrolase (TIGR01450 family)
MNETLDLSKIGLFLFDIDGVFLAGKEDPALISGTRILPLLRQRGIPFRLITNTSTHPRSFLAETLRQRGVDVLPEDIHAALEVTVGVAARRFAGGRVYLVGEAGMRDVAVGAGLQVVAEAPADAVIVGLTRFADYQMLSAAARCMRGGGALRACHRNRMWVDEPGHSLSCGPWVAALEFATGATAEVFGKPEPAFYRAASSALAVPPEHTLMVGDDPFSDVHGAQRVGMKGALVLSGKTSRAELEASGVAPDLVLDEVDALAELLPT